jgi:hypothetical protein
MDRSFVTEFHVDVDLDCVGARWDLAAINSSLFLVIDEFGRRDLDVVEDERFRPNHKNPVVALFTDGAN